MRIIDDYYGRIFNRYPDGHELDSGNDDRSATHVYPMTVRNNSFRPLLSLFEYFAPPIKSKLGGFSSLCEDNTQITSEGAKREVKDNVSWYSLTLT